MINKHEVARLLKKQFEKCLENEDRKFLSKTLVHSIIHMLKERKKEGVNMEFCRVKMENLHFTILVPPKYKNELNIYEVLKDIDDAPATPPYQSFKWLNYTDMSFKFDYLSLKIRSFRLPIFQITKVSVQYLIINALFHPRVLF